MATRIRRVLKRTEFEYLRAPLSVVVSPDRCMESGVKAALPRSAIYRQGALDGHEMAMKWPDWPASHGVLCPKQACNSIS
jgi:hypothetical protein